MPQCGPILQTFADSFASVLNSFTTSQHSAVSNLFRSASNVVACPKVLSCFRWMLLIRSEILSNCCGARFNSSALFKPNVTEKRHKTCIACDASTVLNATMVVHITQSYSRIARRETRIQQLIRQSLGVTQGPRPQQCLPCLQTMSNRRPFVH